MDRMVLFILLMIGQVVCAFALAILIPFYPIFAKEKGISEEFVGLIFGANPIGAILAALTIGKVLTNVILIFNRRKTDISLCVWGYSCNLLDYFFLRLIFIKPRIKLL